MADTDAKPARLSRTDTREAAELRALRERQPELADAADLHIDLLELHRRIQHRVPLPSFEVSAEMLAAHERDGRPLLRFEQIPLEMSDLRLMVRQIVDVLQRHGALDGADAGRVQALGRDMALLAAVTEWYRAVAERRAPATTDDGVLDQVFTLAMRPFLWRCTEVLQLRSDLGVWTHPYCALCGGEPDFAVITPAAERHLICSRCTLRWRFAPLTCPYCGNDDRSRITSFATSDGQYRVYACNACQRYLKTYDGRHADRRVLPMVDSVATLPLDAAAIQRGYRG